MILPRPSPPPCSSSSHQTGSPVKSSLVGEEEGALRGWPGVGRENVERGRKDWGVCSAMRHRTLHITTKGRSTERVRPKANEINRPTCSINAQSHVSRSNCYDMWRTPVHYNY
jgi:hypothetical protein